MTPSTAKKGAIRYRYYVSSMLAQGRTSEAGSVRRVSASEIEGLVVQALRTEYPDDADREERTLITARVQRIILRAGSIDIHLESDPQSPVVLPSSPSATKRQRAILRAAGSDSAFERGIKAVAR